VLLADSTFFELFSRGAEGIASYATFFHLDGLVVDGGVRTFDDLDGGSWDFTGPPLPASLETYRRYLDKVVRFGDERHGSFKQTMRHGT
jgi:hypothetical protein